MNHLADILERATGENEASDMRAKYEVRGQRIRELEGLLEESLDSATGVNSHTLYTRIALALGRKVQ
jgi:hypothetical protein